MSTKSTLKATGWAAVALATVLSGTSRATEPEEYGDGYRSGNFGRVRYAENDPRILRAEWDLEAEPENSVNAPIFPGDAIETAFDQRAEIELAGGHVVRIDRGSRMTFLALPDPYAEVQDNTVLQLEAGRSRLTVLGAGAGTEFRIDTPAATVYALDDADLRIEVDSRQRTRVLSFRGVVEVVAEGGSVLVRAGTACEVAPGLRPSDPAPFSTFALDDFDQWVRARESVYETPASTVASTAYRTLPDEVRPYYRELETYGDWSYSADYGHVWYPVGVGVGWRPYYHGNWGWGPGGYFWISNEPWGWAPYHYGRWVFTPYGWGWVPGSVFGGAWVAWSFGSLYVGWSPLDCYDRPVFVSVTHYDVYDPLSWTFVEYRHLGRHDYTHHRVGYDRARGSLGGAAVVTRPPRVRPDEFARSPEARERAVRAAQDSPRVVARGAARRDVAGPAFREKEQELRRRPEAWTGRPAVASPVESVTPRRSGLARPGAARPGLVKPDLRVPTEPKTGGKSLVAPRPGATKPSPRGESRPEATKPSPRGESRPEATKPSPRGEPRPTPPASGGKTANAPRSGRLERLTGKDAPAHRLDAPRQATPGPAPSAEQAPVSRRSHVIGKPRSGDPGTPPPPAARRGTPMPSAPRTAGQGGPMRDVYRKMAQPRKPQAPAPRAQAPVAQPPRPRADAPSQTPPASKPAPKPTPAPKAKPQKSPEKGGRAIGPSSARPRPPSERSGGGSRHGSSRGR